MTKDLRQERAKLIEDMRSLNSKAETENRDLNTEEAVSYDKMRSDAATLKARYERLEETETMERELGQSRGAIVDPLQGRTVNGDVSIGQDYKRAMDMYLRTGSARQFRDMNVTTSADGGYTLPTDAAANIVLALNRGSVVRKAGANVLQTSKNTVISVGSVVTGAWEGETSAYGGGSDTDSTLTAFAANAFKYTVGTKVSEELMDDSAVDIQQFITGRFLDSWMQASDNAYMGGAGSGSHQPTGVIGSATQVTAASATTFTKAELLAFFYSLPYQYRTQTDCAFMMNDATIGYVASLAAPGATDTYINFAPGLNPGDPDKLFGKPIYSTAALDNTFTANHKLIVVGSWKYYQIVDRIKQFGLKRLNELFAETGQVGFLGSFRTDGKCLLPDAFRKLVLAAS